MNRSKFEDVVRAQGWAAYLDSTKDEHDMDAEAFRVLMKQKVSPHHIHKKTGMSRHQVATLIKIYREQK